MPQTIETVRERDETALLRRVARGDESAVTELFRSHGDVVFRFLYRRTGECYEDAQDLTQETFLAAISLAGTFDGSCSVTTWLCSLAKPRSADFLRRQGRDKRIPRTKLVEFDAEGSQALADLRSGEISIEQALERMDARAFLDGVTEQLSDDEKNALLLHYVEGFSVVEMTRILNRSAKGVESLITRAKRRCKETGTRWLVEG